MDISIIERLSDIDRDDWNRLALPHDNPFLRYEFLAALENHDCASARWGWSPRHVILRDGAEVLGAMPLYLKDNSYGEFVFDWSWADAYQRAGGRYYPKLVSAIPYSPVTGPRLLVRDNDNALKTAMQQRAIEEAQRQQLSSVHWLFPPTDEAVWQERQGLMRRSGTQFHWFNYGYRDFDDFLDRFTASKRKKVKRERRRVVEQDIEIEVFDGERAGDAEWAAWSRFYVSTFQRYGGYATLNDGFFRELGQTMPESVVLVMARHQGRYVAGAFCLRGETALFGRHWGCDDAFHSLHFEACYYAGIDYCINHGLARFEPGAQGEHKVGRGFEPIPTWSAHWVADVEFSSVLERYLVQERDMMDGYMHDLTQHLPFKESS